MSSMLIIVHDIHLAQWEDARFIGCLILERRMALSVLFTSIVIERIHLLVLELTMYMNNNRGIEQQFLSLRTKLVQSQQGIA